MKRVAVIGAGVLTIAGLGFALYQSHGLPSQVTRDISMHATYVPENASLLDFENYHRNLMDGDSLGTSLAMESFLGRARGVLTGLSMPATGEKQMVITVQDDEADLSHAEVYLNDQQAASATVANGGIVTRAGQSLATMTILVPPSPPHHVYVEWTSSLGVSQRQTLYGY